MLALSKKLLGLATHSLAHGVREGSGTVGFEVGCNVWPLLHPLLERPQAGNGQALVVVWKLELGSPQEVVDGYVSIGDLLVKKHNLS